METKTVAMPIFASNDPLYQAALAVEKDEELSVERDEWETATIEDGLADGNPRRNYDRSA